VYTGPEINYRLVIQDCTLQLQKSGHSCKGTYFKTGFLEQ